MNVLKKKLREGQYKMSMFMEKGNIKYNFSDPLEDLKRIRKTKELKKIKSIHNIWLLTDEEIHKIRLLNVFLTGFEKELKTNVVQVMQNSKEYCHIHKDLIFDEVEVTIEFYLDKNDPEYLEDMDNVILEIHDYFDDETWDYGIVDNNCHNVLVNKEGHVMEQDKHCRLMHVLYDDTDLSWDEILRIGAITMEYQVLYKTQFIEIF